jgi:hypothetical protein
MAKTKRGSRGNSSGDPGQGSYPGSVQQPPGAAAAFPPGSWSPNVAVKPGGMKPPRQRGVADYGTYSTGDPGLTIGTEAPPNAQPWNQPVAPTGGQSPVGGGPAYRRNVENPENAGSRLAVSPSMKIMDPTGFAAATQANGRIVSSGPPGRSSRVFWQGALQDTAPDTAAGPPPAPGDPGRPALIERHPVGDVNV